MLSRFFIDRPIFATVLSVLITLVGAGALASLPVAQYPQITPPAVVVAMSYPGASAQVVAETVAAPIEQYVNGVPGMLYMSSQSGNDGSYALTCTFDVGSNLNAALVMVQNRVTLALPLLPTQVQRQGITIRKKTPDILQVINFTSPDGRYDDVYLSNFVLINVRDELLRVDGVSDVNVMGQRDYSVRAWLDPQALAARHMTAADVANAVRTQSVEAALGQIGQAPTGGGLAFQFPIDALGRLHEPQQFADVVVKTGRRPSPASRGSGASSGGGGAGGSPTDSSLPGPLTAQDFMAGTSGATQTGAASTATGGTTPVQGAGSGNSGSTTTTPTTTLNVVTTSGTSGLVQRPTNSPAPLRTTIVNTVGGGTTAGGATTGAASGSSGGNATAATGASGAATNGGGGGPIGSAASLGMTDLPTSRLTDVVGNGGPDNGAISAPSLGRGPEPPSTAIVRLRDVARVEMGALNYNQAALFDGKPAVGLIVYQLPGTNALDVADAVRARLKELSPRFPEGVAYTIGYDTTPFTRESIAEVFKTLRDAILLVAIVVLIFLQDWRAMVLPMIDVPVSLVGTFAVMAGLGYSLNNISLFGLVLAIGIVVDDAIVVLENIERQMAKGLEPREATLKAMEEITGPVVAITLVLCAVFVPCAFISGITGRFFQQFAVTIAASTVISAVNALTMTPSRALMILRGGGLGGAEGQPREALPWWIFGLAGGWLSASYGPPLLAVRLGLPVPLGAVAAETAWHAWGAYAAWFAPGLLAGLGVGWCVVRPVNALLRRAFRVFDRLFEWATAAYGWTVGMAMRLAVVVLVLYAGLLGLTWWAFQTAPTGFVPQQDMGRCLAGVQLPDSASLERTKGVMARIEKIARETPGVAHTIVICGTSFVLQANGPNFGSLFIILKPFAERQRPDLSDEAIMARLRRRWGREVVDAQAFVFGAPPIPGVSVAGGFKVIVEDRGGLGIQALQAQTNRLIGRLKSAPGLVGASTQFRSGVPQLHLDVDWAKAAALGLSPDDVNQTLSIYLGSSYVNNFNGFGRYWQVTLQADGRFRSRPSDVGLLQARNKWGMMVPLGTLVKAREVAGPAFINRYNLYTAAPVTGSLSPGTSSGDIISVVDRAAGASLPRSMKADWTELMFLQIREGSATPPSVVFALSILVVFLALSALYESWSLPLAVILVVPMCLLCAAGGVLYTNTSVNIFVQIGLVVLVGLACKNAILIVEFAREKNRSGAPVFEATREAARQRLRPIVMTSSAFILGVLPLLYSSGAGAEMRRSLGTAVFSGMLGVTLFGLVLTPVFFYVLQGFGQGHLFASPATRPAVSCALGVALGAAGGYLLGRLGVFPTHWAAAVGGVVGLFGVSALANLPRRLRA